MVPSLVKSLGKLRDGNIQSSTRLHRKEEPFCLKNKLSKRKGLVILAYCNSVASLTDPGKVVNVNTTIFIEGEDAILFCDVSGGPPPVVSWFNDKNENVYNGSLWKLKSINRSYNGTYQCIASNSCGMVNKTFDIIVQCKL